MTEKRTENPAATAKHISAATGRRARYVTPKSSRVAFPPEKNNGRGATATRKRVMGAHFTCEIFDGKLTTSELRRQYEQRLEELTYEHGHDAYNGTLTTTSGLCVEEKVFDSRPAAEEYVADKTNKWGEALAVKFREVVTEISKKPTYNGKDLSHNIVVHVGEHRLWTVASFYENGCRYGAAADELTTAQKVTAVALYSDYENKTKALDVLQRAIRTVLGHMEPVSSAPPAAAVMRELHKSIKQRLKAHAAVQKAAAKLVAFDARHTPKIYATKQVDHGVQWLVGGWAAE